jgi:prepilin-type N-terminal cleavage/methylation domain-containing protein
MPHSTPSTLRSRRGFTIIEIVVVLIIIALMLVIIVPHFFSELKVRKAQRIKDDLATLNSAIEHYALDNGKTSGAELDYADLRKYLDPKTDVYRSAGKDIFGDTYGPFTVGSRPSVPPNTSDRLSNVVGEEFWSPYQ